MNPEQTVQLRGIAWNHSRGFTPMVATAQRFEELHPEVTIRWEKRSLQEFADQPVQRLAEQFDLLVIDHPFTGYAAGHNVLRPLDGLLPDAFLKEMAAQCAGPSHASYEYGGHLWAVAVDGATPVSACRPDILESHRITVPESWEEMLELARRGLVTVPAFPVDCLMYFFMLCATLGEEPGSQEARLISEETGANALELLRALVTLCDPACLTRNPIRTFELMAGTDKIAYCPFAYGYSNYARPGYARYPLEFGDLVTLGTHGRLRSTLGGAGLALSARCAHPEVAAQYLQFAASAECQRTIYFHSGGQPARIEAWRDGEVNRASNGFFQNTLAAMERAYLRPRYDGYITFQEQAEKVVHDYVARGGGTLECLTELGKLYINTRRGP